MGSQPFPLASPGAAGQESVLAAAELVVLVAEGDRGLAALDAVEVVAIGNDGVGGEWHYTVDR